MGVTKKVSASAIINCSDNILKVSQKISTKLSNLSRISSNLQNNINKLSEYNGAKVAGSTHIIEKTETTPQKIEYSKWQITGYESLESDISELETMISNLTTANEYFAQSINNMISTACEIDGLREEIEKILSSNNNFETSTVIFFKMLVDKTLEYPEIKKEGFTPQSITTVGNNYLVSAYKKGENSKIYIYDKVTKKLTGEIILNNRAHVGGISYDEKNNILYVAGSKGTVNIYDYNKIKKNLTKSKVVDLNADMEASSIRIDNNITINKKEANNKSSIQTKVGKSATLYQKDGKLYVATFDGIHKGEVVEYETKVAQNTSGAKTFQSHITNKYEIEPRTQGIAEVNYNNKDYLVTTQSIGFTSSQITLYEKNGNSIQEVGKYSGLQKGLEGITVKGNELTMCYETGTKNTSRITMNELVEKCSSGKYNPSLPTKMARFGGGVHYTAKGLVEGFVNKLFKK